MNRILIFLALMPAVTATNAQKWSHEELAMIQATAADICDSLKQDVPKGSKTTLQVQGEIEAKVIGLTAKLAKAGGDVNGKLNKTDYEGISQEAAEAAKKGDRDCRERVFNKMFDDLRASPQKGSMYNEDKKRNDMRVVQTRLNPEHATTVNADPSNPCSYAQRYAQTNDLALGGAQFRIMNWEIEDTEKCIEMKTRYEGTTTCTADMKDLDDAVMITFPAGALINCLNGECLKCDEDGRYRYQSGAWQPKVRAFRTRKIEVHVDPYGRDKRDYYEVLRALARLIGNGNDRAFCQTYPEACK